MAKKEKRVLRVEIAEDWITKKTTLKQDDQLHLKLMWNGSQSRNYRLESTGNGRYETAIQIPESAADINARVILNFKSELFFFEEIVIKMNGGKLRLNYENL